MRVPCTKCLGRGAKCKVTGGGRTNECDLCRFSRIKCEGLELACKGAKSASAAVTGSHTAIVIPARIGSLEEEKEKGSALETRKLMQSLIHHLERSSQAQEQLVEEMKAWQKAWRAREAGRGRASGSD